MNDLHELMVDPRRVAELTQGEATAALVELASLQTAIAVRLRELPTTEPAVTAVPENDRLLTAEEVAGRFNRSVAWVYRQAKHWNFTRRVTRRTIRFSEAGLQRFLSNRRAFVP